MHRRLVPGRDVGRGGVVQRVDAAQQPEVERGELVALGIAWSRRSRARAGGGAGAPRSASGRRTARTRSSARPDSSTRSASCSRSRMSPNRSGPSRVDRGEQSLACAASRRGRRRSARAGGQRDADLLAAVLEREHLLDAGQRGQRGGAIGPRLDHGAGARVGLSVPNEPSCSGLKHTTSQRPTEVAVRSRPDATQVGEGVGARGIRCGELGPERRRPVLEDRDVVACGDLGRVRPAAAVRAGRASAGGRKTRFWRAAAIEIHSPVSGSGACGAVAGARVEHALRRSRARPQRACRHRRSR